MQPSISTIPESQPVDFTAAIRQIVREEIQNFTESISPAPVEQAPRTYSRKQVCDCLKCSFPTFHRLANLGAFQTIKRGRATLVLADDFDAQLKSGNIGKYRRY